MLLEDCAHSLGVTYKGEHTGHHGVVCCISSQSYKMINSGEGGFLLTDDDEMAAKAICYAGAYEKLYQKHVRRAEPQPELLLNRGRLFACIGTSSLEANPGSPPPRPFALLTRCSSA